MRGRARKTVEGDGLAAFLAELHGLSPVSENIARYVWRVVRETVPDLRSHIPSPDQHHAAEGGNRGVGREKSMNWTKDGATQEAGYGQDGSGAVGVRVQGRQQKKMPDCSVKDADMAGDGTEAGKELSDLEVRDVVRFQFVRRSGVRRTGCWQWRARRLSARNGYAWSGSRERGRGPLKHSFQWK